MLHALRLAARQSVADPRGALLRVRMAAWVIVASAMARATSLPRAHRLLSVPVKPASADLSKTTVNELRRAIDSVLSCDVFVFRPSCWKRSLVLHRFLSLHGVETHVNFGVRRTRDGGLAGHAWLEHRGEPLFDDDVLSYAVTFRLPPAAAAPELAPPSAWVSHSR